MNEKLRTNDPELFANFIRMNACGFDELAVRVTPHIKKNDSRFRKAISPAEKMALTLPYLATGDSYGTLMYLFRLSKASVCNLIDETCNAIYDSLKDDYLKIPNSKKEWEAIANKFEAQWNFLHCIGALDGKLIEIKAPARSGSEYFNYKKTNSIVLMALADAEYKFTYIDVGCYERESDGGVFAICTLSKALEENSINIPPPIALPLESTPIPYVIIADDSFPIRPYLIKPYAFRNQDMTLECSTIGCHEHGALLKMLSAFVLPGFVYSANQLIENGPEKVVRVILAICALHYSRRMAQ